jgi:NAD(P)-dependent dehydrogenase (short-subunit alcohol dehydrogenase family)
VAETTPAQWDRVIGVNLRGAFFCAQAAARLMPRGGRIVNIADVGGVRAWPGYIP